MIIVNCKNIIDKESFWNEMQNNFTCDCDWFGRNFDALDDALQGNCGLFQENEHVIVSIINIAEISNRIDVVSLIISMLEVVASYAYEIKSDDYSTKYIKNLKTIDLGGYKNISLNLYQNNIV